jgi:hypothetical protein
VYWSGNTDLAVEGEMNVEFPHVTCVDCGAGCDVCSSFSALKKNIRGFGGKDCVRAGDRLKCACCQAIIRCGHSMEAVRKTVMAMSERWRRRGE